MREGVSADLAAGRWAAGARISLKELGEQYGTSESNVSTTLRRLSEQGALEARPLVRQQGCAYYVPQVAAVRALPMAA